MYYLSKIVWFVLEPSNLLTFLALGGLILSLCGHRAGAWLGVVSVAGLLALGIGPVSNLLLNPLEERFRPFVEDGRPIAGAIILGGATDPDVTIRRGQLALNEAGERITAMVELARRYPEARIVFTGGSGELVGVASEAVAIEQTIGRLAPGLRVTYERASRNTVENAEMTRAQVLPQPNERWLLVTSAWHMPRSIGIFRKAGWNVTAYPVDFRTTGTTADYRPFPSLSQGLRRSDIAVKEWVGLLFGWLTGKTSALFPA